jgi:hypothetical protein
MPRAMHSFSFDRQIGMAAVLRRLEEDSVALFADDGVDGVR